MGWTPILRKLAEYLHIQREWWVNRTSKDAVISFDCLPDCDQLAYRLGAELILKIIKENENT